LPVWVCYLYIDENGLPYRSPLQISGGASDTVPLWLRRDGKDGMFRWTVDIDDHYGLQDDMPGHPELACALQLFEMSIQPAPQPEGEGRACGESM